MPTYPFGIVFGAMVMTGHTLIVTGNVPEQPFASVARTVTLTPEPFIDVGVPLIIPELLRLNPAGQVPVTVVHV